MSVLSWRSLSFSASGLVEFFTLSSWPLIFRIPCLALFPLIMLAGCNAKPLPDFIFTRQALSQQEFSRAKAECTLEAEKAAMIASNSITAGENWRKILVLCMEAKGARFERMAD